MKGIVFMLLDNVVISVFESNFIKKKGDIDLLKCVVCRT